RRAGRRWNRPSGFLSNGWCRNGPRQREVNKVVVHKAPINVFHVTDWHNSDATFAAYAFSLRRRRFGKTDFCAALALLRGPPPLKWEPDRLTLRKTKMA